jgi:hypothetical protein
VTGINTIGRTIRAADVIAVVPLTDWRLVGVVENPFIHSDEGFNNGLLRATTEQADVFVLHHRILIDAGNDLHRIHLNSIAGNRAAVALSARK